MFGRSEDAQERCLLSSVRANSFDRRGTGECAGMPYQIDNSMIDLDLLSWLGLGLGGLPHEVVFGHNA